MILRIDDTDLERNTEQSLQSIFDGLKWLGLGWDEKYRQSERLDLHRTMAEAILAKGLAYRDFTPLHVASADGLTNVDAETRGAWLANPGQREMSAEESDHRAAAGEEFVIRYRVPRGTGEALRFTDLVYGEQEKSLEPIEEGFTRHRKELIARIREGNRELADAIISDRSDSQRVKAAVEKIHRAQGDLQDAVLEHVFAMRPILSDGQYQRLTKMTADALRDAPELQ